MALTKIDDRGLKTPIDLLDNEKIRLGTGNDIELYHDGTNSIIKNTQGQTRLVQDYFAVRNGADNEYMIYGQVDNTVQLYYDGSKKFETLSDGVKINGILHWDVGNSGRAIELLDNQKIFLGDGTDLQIFHNGSTSIIDSTTCNLDIQSSNTINIKAADESSVVAHANGAVELYHDNSKKLETTSSGATISGANPVLELAGTASTSGNTFLHINANANHWCVGADNYSSQNLFVIKDGTPSSSTHRFCINNSGNVGIGTTSPIDLLQLSNATAQKKLVLSKVNSGTADEHGMWLRFENYGPASTGRADGTIIGKIHFYASQPTSGNLQDAGAIECRADGSQTGNNTRSRLSFLTVDSQTATERMRIANNGRVAIGTSLDTVAAGNFQVIEESGSGDDNDCNAYFETNRNDWNIKTYYNQSGTHYHIQFVEQGTQRGYISGSDGSNVTYASGSDYRWKENVVRMTGSEGIDICKKLKPSKYNWIENREVTGQINTVDGFIAHEVAEAGVLGAVIGEKDAVKEDGSIDGQVLDYGQLTPVLAAGIKGLIDKVETLETKVAALEAA